MNRIYIFTLIIFTVSACTPKVEVAMPTEPITINLNVKIDHQVRVQVDKELEDIFSDDSGLF
ncbi:MAG: YnbE family lipoprotein [Psychromonas sp.]